MPTRDCARCGKPFAARSAGHKFCSDSCRKRAHEDGAPSAPVLEMDHPVNVDVSLVERVRAELAAVGRENTARGQAALIVAHRLEHSQMETGASLAALGRQFSQALSDALAGAAKVADPVDELKARRDAKRSAS